MRQLTPWTRLNRLVFVENSAYLRAIAYAGTVFCWRFCAFLAPLLVFRQHHGASAGGFSAVSASRLDRRKPRQRTVSFPPAISSAVSITPANLLDICYMVGFLDSFSCA
jgi:hypothetical protein